MIDQTTGSPDDALLSLYRTAFPDCARMIHRMGGTLEQAKDSFHDALLIYMEKEKAGTLRLRSSPKAYLLGTAKICWLRAQDKRSTLPLTGEHEPAEPGETDHEELEERESTLLKSLQKAGQKCLELLSAFYYDHCSLQDIAARFGFKGRRSATVAKFKCLEKVRHNVKKSQVYAQ
jgi:DNA-directed RNA polymerase specialized sigma24 family protein